MIKLKQIINESPNIYLKGKSVYADDIKLKNLELENITDNIVFFRVPIDGFFTEGFSLIYFMDSAESAQKMKDGQIPYLRVPIGTFMSGGNPITDIWKKRFQKPGTEHILGVMECNTKENLIYVDMLTVRKNYQKNKIASMMLNYVKHKYPTAQIKTSSRTEPGEKFFKKNNVNENMSFNDLLKLTTPERIEKSKNVRTRSIPVTVEENNEQWNFRYKSSYPSSTTDKPFQGSITFLKKGNVNYHKDNAEDLECKVDCSCPDFRFRFAFNDTQKNASQIGPDSLNKCINKRPQPAYDQGMGLCKHLVSLKEYLKTNIDSLSSSSSTTNKKPNNLFEAIKNIANRGPFNITYKD